MISASENKSMDPIILLIALDQNIIHLILYMRLF